VRTLIANGAIDYLCGKCKCGIADNIDLEDIDALLGSDSGSDKDAEQQEQEPQQQQEEQVKDYKLTNEEVGTSCSSRWAGWLDILRLTATSAVLPQLGGKQQVPDETFMCRSVIVHRMGLIEMASKYIMPTFPAHIKSLQLALSDGCHGSCSSGSKASWSCVSVQYLLSLTLSCLHVLLLPAGSRDPGYYCTSRQARGQDTGIPGQRAHPWARPACAPLGLWIDTCVRAVHSGVHLLDVSCGLLA
jgi:hypothetical protein